MNSSPEKKTIENAKQLYHTIGQIDDRYIAEAIDYRRKKERSPWLLPTISIVSSIAAILLVLTVSTVFLLPFFPEYNSGSAAAPGSRVYWSVADGYRENTALINCLAKNRGSAEASETAPVPTDEVMIVWRDESDGTYYSVTLDSISDEELDFLRDMLSDAEAELQIAPDSDAPPFSLWITTGDGYVLSPYLPTGDGTVSFGHIDDYSPEQLPKEKFAAFIMQLITRNAKK